MRERYNFIALAVFVLAMLAMTFVIAHAQDEDTATRVLRQINRARADASLPELTRNPFLDASAQGHADDLMRNGARLGHRGSNGSNFQARIKWAGYNADAVGENWASYRNLDQIMDFWLKDPPHRRNILSNKFSEIGIGVVIRANGGLIVVTDFGSPMSAAEIQVAQAAQAAAEAKKKAKPTQVPTKAKPKPTAVPPTRKPKPQPTAVPAPRPAPTLPPQPTVVQIALAEPPAKPVAVPLRVRGKPARIALQGNAFVEITPAPKFKDGTQKFYGSVLAFGGVFLVGVAVVGQRRRRLR